MSLNDSAAQEPAPGAGDVHSFTDAPPAPDRLVPVEELLQRVTLGMNAHQGGQLVHVERLEGRAPEYAPLSPPLPPPLQRALASMGAGQLYTHQVEAIQRVRAGENVVVVTATSSGKTLCYNLPILETMLHDRAARALYIYPINALVNDQHKGLFRLNLTLGHDAVSVVRYTGAQNAEQRKVTRAREPNIVLTNPEMIHLSFLLWHEKWESLWRNLRYVVVDEVHTYRGVFGSNMSQLFRRIRRVAAHYGASPQFICCSATMANPQELAETLTGLDFSVVDRNGAGTGRKYFVLWNPPLVAGDQENLRRSYAEESAELLLHCLQARYNTIVFARARRLTENMLRMSQNMAQERGEMQLPERIASYRAGYLADEREEIENRLKTGEVQGVITTNALEMGIDIGGLDAAIISGYPGTIMSTWQQAGRAGRRGRDALIMLVGSQNPLDQHYINHPDEFFAQPHERAVVDLDNPHITLKHLLCAARELAFSGKEMARIPVPVSETLSALRQAGLLEPCPGDPEGLRYPPDLLDIHFKLSLRAAGHETYRIMDEARNQVGTIEPPNVFREAHPGAIYQHGGDDYRVTYLDRQQKLVRVREENIPHYTQAISYSSVRVERVHATRSLEMDGTPYTVSVGDVLVEEHITGYREMQLGGDTLVKRVNLSQPLVVRLHTTATWITLPVEVSREITGPPAEDEADPLAGGLHAIQHLLTAVMPLLVMCDRRDVDGHYELEHPDVGGPAVFVYDICEGGIGLAEVAYQQAEDLLRLAHDVVHRCGCSGGCPACIQSGVCRMHNDGLDKEAARALLSRLVAPCGEGTSPDSRPRRGAGAVGPPATPPRLERALRDLQERTRRRGLLPRRDPSATDASCAGATDIAATPARPRFAPGDAVELAPYGRGTVESSRMENNREVVRVRWARRGRISDVDASRGGLRKIENGGSGTS
jgi:DEAD/DEAH box helicase domain-containing protein